MKEMNEQKSSNLNDSNADSLKKAFLLIFEELQREHSKKTGKEIKLYKRLEPYKLVNFFNTFMDKNDEPLYEIISKLIDELIRIHALPNANHRTTIYFTKALLNANGIPFPDYDIVANEDRWIKDFNRFVQYSRSCIIETDMAFIGRDARFDPLCHYNKTKKWVSEVVNVQSDNWRAIFSVKDLFIKLISHSLAPSRSASSFISSSVTVKDMSSEHINTLGLVSCTTMSQVQSVRESVRKKYIAGEITTEQWKQFDELVNKKIKELR